jgi:hypothetical protein
METRFSVLAVAGAIALLATVAEARAQERSGAPNRQGGEREIVDTVRGRAPTMARTPVSNTTPASAESERPAENFYRSQREIPLGNWGVGYELSFSLRERKVYREDFDTAKELFNQLAFVRYGHEGVVGRPYIRVGALDTSRLGYGQVLAYYDNTPLGATWQKRGLEAGMNFGRAGFEVIAGNIQRLEVVGGRVYGKPLQGYVGGKLGELQVGLSGATDFAPGAGYTGISIQNEARIRSGSVAGERYPRPTMVGGDITLPLYRRDGTDLLTYVDVGKLRGGGHGGVLALQLTQQVRHSQLIAKFEHREVSNGYRAGFFDNGYERERFVVSGNDGDLWRPVNTRYRTVLNSVSGGPAAWVETRVLMPRWSIWSFYARQYRDSKSGWLHVELDSRTMFPRVSMHVWYDKWRIDGARDVFRMDDRAAVQAAAALRLYRNAHLFALSRWSFSPLRDGSGAVVDYATQRYSERRVTLRVPF